MLYITAATPVWAENSPRPGGRSAPAPSATSETATAESAAPSVQDKMTPASAETAAWEAETQATGDVVTDTVSPVGTTINLFDYWITTRFAPDNVNPPDMDQGINAGKLLQFTASAPRNPNGGINDYTGSAKPRTGIVQNTLSSGYPILSQGGRSLA